MNFTIEELLYIKSLLPLIQYEPQSQGIKNLVNGILLKLSKEIKEIKDKESIINKILIDNTKELNTISKRYNGINTMYYFATIMNGIFKDFSLTFKTGVFEESEEEEQFKEYLVKEGFNIFIK